MADLNRGAFGFVQLAKDLETGEQVAIKFIERGEKVYALPLQLLMPTGQGADRNNTIRHDSKHKEVPVQFRSASTWRGRS